MCMEVNLRRHIPTTLYHYTFSTQNNPNSRSPLHSGVEGSLSSNLDWISFTGVFMELNPGDIVELHCATCIKELYNL